MVARAAGRGDAGGLTMSLERERDLCLASAGGLKAEAEEDEAATRGED